MTASAPAVQAMVEPLASVSEVEAAVMAVCRVVIAAPVLKPGIGEIEQHARLQRAAVIAQRGDRHGADVELAGGEAGDVGAEGVADDVVAARQRAADRLEIGVAPPSPGRLLATMVLSSTMVPELATPPPGVSLAVLPEMVQSLMLMMPALSTAPPGPKRVLCCRSRCYR